MTIKLHSKWQAATAYGRKDAITYTVRGVTDKGVYVTPDIATRSPSHLYSEERFLKLFREAPST